jgi:hypothetical protein
LEQRGELKCRVGVWAVAATTAAVKAIQDKYFAFEQQGMFKAYL